MSDLDKLFALMQAADKDDSQERWSRLVYYFDAKKNLFGHTCSAHLGPAWRESLNTMSHDKINDWWNGHDGRIGVHCILGDDLIRLMINTLEGWGYQA